jgi:hypothetical protein
LVSSRAAHAGADANTDNVNKAPTACLRVIMATLSMDLDSAEDYASRTSAREVACRTVVRSILRAGLGRTCRRRVSN